MQMNNKGMAVLITFTGAIMILLAVALCFPVKQKVMVLSTFQTVDELGYEWHVIEYLVDGHLEQVNCNSAEQAQRVRNYLGVK